MTAYWHPASLSATLASARSRVIAAAANAFTATNARQESAYQSPQGHTKVIVQLLRVLEEQAAGVQTLYVQTVRVTLSDVVEQMECVHSIQHFDVTNALKMSCSDHVAAIHHVALRAHQDSILESTPPCRLYALYLVKNASEERVGLEEFAEASHRHRNQVGHSYNP